MGVSTDLDFSLTFSQNMDYSSLRESVFRLSRANGGATIHEPFGFSLAAALDDSTLGLNVEFWNDTAGGNLTTVDNRREERRGGNEGRSGGAPWH